MKWFDQFVQNLASRNLPKKLQIVGVLQLLLIVSVIALIPWVSVQYFEIKESGLAMVTQNRMTLNIPAKYDSMIGQRGLKLQLFLDHDGEMKQVFCDNIEYSLRDENLVLHFNCPSHLSGSKRFELFIVKKSVPDLVFSKVFETIHRE